VGRDYESVITLVTWNFYGKLEEINFTCTCCIVPTVHGLILAIEPLEYVTLNPDNPLAGTVTENGRS
jgi:hypothetical protein